MTPKILQHAKIIEIAAEYRSKGYDVRVNPTTDDTPAFLGNFTPDVIATSADDLVIVQVMASPDSTSRAVEVANAVASNPPWRFELVAVSPQAAPDVPSFGDIVSDEHIESMLDDANVLIRQHHLEAAALVAWSAVEAILRRRAASEGLDLERASSSRLVPELYSLGLIEPALYTRLLKLMEFRNAVAHGFRPRNDAPDIESIVIDARKLRNAA